MKRKDYPNREPSGSGQKQCKPLSLEDVLKALKIRYNTHLSQALDLIIALALTEDKTNGEFIRVALDYQKQFELFRGLPSLENCFDAVIKAGTVSCDGETLYKIEEKPFVLCANMSTTSPAKKTRVARVASLGVDKTVVVIDMTALMAKFREQCFEKLDAILLKCQKDGSSTARYLTQTLPNDSDLRPEYLALYHSYKRVLESRNLQILSEHPAFAAMICVKAEQLYRDLGAVITNISAYSRALLEEKTNITLFWSELFKSSHFYFLKSLWIARKPLDLLAKWQKLDVDLRVLVVRCNIFYRPVSQRSEIINYYKNTADGIALELNDQGDVFKVKKHRRTPEESSVLEYFYEVSLDAISYVQALTSSPVNSEFDPRTLDSLVLGRDLLLGLMAYDMIDNPICYRITERIFIVDQFFESHNGIFLKIEQTFNWLKYILQELVEAPEDLSKEDALCNENNALIKKVEGSCAYLRKTRENLDARREKALSILENKKIALLQKYQSSTEALRKEIQDYCSPNNPEISGSYGYGCLGEVFVLRAKFGDLIDKFEKMKSVFEFCEDNSDQGFYLDLQNVNQHLQTLKNHQRNLIAVTYTAYMKWYQNVVTTVAKDKSELELLSHQLASMKSVDERKEGIMSDLKQLQKALPENNAKECSDLCGKIEHLIISQSRTQKILANAEKVLKENLQTLLDKSKAITPLLALLKIYFEAMVNGEKPGKALFDESTSKAQEIQSLLNKSYVLLKQVRDVRDEDCLVNGNLKEFCDQFEAFKKQYGDLVFHYASLSTKADRMPRPGAETEGQYQQALDTTALALNLLQKGNRLLLDYDSALVNISQKSQLEKVIAQMKVFVSSSDENNSLNAMISTLSDKRLIGVVNAAVKELESTQERVKCEVERYDQLSQQTTLSLFSAEK